MYRVYVYDDSCYMFWSLDTGATWALVGTPTDTLGDIWTDMAMPVNDGDYDTICAVDQMVSSSYQPSKYDFGGGVQIATKDTASTATVIRYSDHDPDTGGYFRGYSAACTAYGQTILVATYIRTNDDPALYPRISRDGGATWTSLSSVAAPGNPGFTTCCFGQSGAIMYIHAAGAGVYKSTDSGATWTLLSGTPAWAATPSAERTLRLRCSQNGSVVAGISWDGAFSVSTNGGATWTATNFATLVGEACAMGDFGMSLDGLVMVVTFTHGANIPAAYKSANHGLTWTALAPPTTTWNPAVSNISPDGLGIVIAYENVGTGSTPVDISADGGATWMTTTLTLHQGSLTATGNWVSAYILPLASVIVPPGPTPPGPYYPPPVDGPPYLREMTYRHRTLGRHFDPSIVVVKDRPGPIRLVEFIGVMK